MRLGRTRPRRRVYSWVILTVLLSLAGASGCASHRSAPLDTAQVGSGTYWCPMHVHIRGIEGDKCPICGMALVPAAASDYRPYLLEVELEPAALHVGQRGTLRLHVRDPRTGAAVTQFELLHERVFHLFIVSHDLEYFDHVHPTLHSDGRLEADVRLPRPGPYRLIADFLPQAAPPQLVEKTIVTAGYRGSIAAAAAPRQDPADKVVDGVRVKLFSPPPVAGREQLLTFELSDEATGRPVENLEPYLAATGHLLVLNADLSVAFHSHPVAAITSQFGPTIVFQLVFPRSGMYRVWVQFQRGGRVSTASFTLPASDRAS
jgi:hypothetical protein